jgi:hypothetical protein
VGAMRPLQQVLANEGITQTEYDDIATNPQFQSYLTLYTNELKDTGFSFSAKSRILAEDLLPTVYHMARDPDVPAPVRMKSIENLVEWGDLKPKTALNQGPGGGFSITINLPGTLTTPAEIIEIAPNVQENVQNGEKMRKKVLPVAFEEPEDYEYAGDDVYE